MVSKGKGTVMTWNKWFLLTALLLVLCVGHTGAQELDDFQNAVTVRGGYFTAARAGFQDLYGDQFNGLIQYDQYMSEKYGFGVDAGFVILKRSDFPIKYRNFYFSPHALYRFVRSSGFNLYGSAGLGLNFRRISIDFVFTDEFGNPQGSDTYNQNDFGPSVNLGLGAEIMVSPQVFISPRVMFDFIYDSSPDKGDFGNTGGFNFTV
jgi:opacity protein-like surface antigen